ncbi:MAG: IS110 family RNA-guided transposase [Planctomycetota bacterium]|jgi:transposase
MKTPKQYLRFCGIDVAKRKHVACIIDQSGRCLTRPKSIRNDAAGYQQILNCLKQSGRKKAILTGMEATGHYWYGLHDFLTRHGYTVAVLNPIQTAQQAKQAIRKCKTDKYDAFHIANLLRCGQYKAAVIPGELAMTCRLLTRLRYRMVRQSAMIKQLVNSRLHPVWPEYEELFSNTFGTTSMELLQTAPTPKELLELDLDDLSERIRKASRGRFGPAHTQKILYSAKNSVGMQRGHYGISTGIKFLLEQIVALEPVRKKLDLEIQKLAARLPEYLFTLPGATELTIVSLYGEVDPIETFERPSQLVAFAGLDPKVFQSGQYDAPRRRVSKRGSPYLRRTLWQMAYRSVCTEGDLRDFWRRKHRQNKHHLVAVTAAANKLCHIAWRIMTDRRDYIPKGHNPKS